MTPSLKRNDIQQLAAEYNLSFDKDWKVVDHFEKIIADFFGAPYAVAVDCCTHALELCLRLYPPTVILDIPRQTYMSVPMMLDKIGVSYRLAENPWDGQYDVVPGKIVDAATLWKRNSYRPGTLMCISFQFRKYLAIGRGGMVLLDNASDYHRLQKMSRDGRNREIDQYSDNITELGYHYYMTPEDAARGIILFNKLADLQEYKWAYKDYRDLIELDYFKDKEKS